MINHAQPCSTVINGDQRCLGGLKVDDSEAKKEASEWERRRARVTAALVPGLKKCLAAPLGSGRHGWCR